MDVLQWNKQGGKREEMRSERERADHPGPWGGPQRGPWPLPRVSWEPWRALSRGGTQPDTQCGLNTNYSQRHTQLSVLFPGVPTSPLLLSLNLVPSVHVQEPRDV